MLRVSEPSANGLWPRRALRTFMGCPEQSSAVIPKKIMKQSLYRSRTITQIKPGIGSLLVGSARETIRSGNLHKRIQTWRAFCTPEAIRSAFGNPTSAHHFSTLTGLKALRGSLLASRLQARQKRPPRVEFPVPAMPGRRWHTNG